MEPIVVVAHPRSGSNSLVEILGLALPAPLLNEPFNERHHLWGPQQRHWRERVTDPASLDAVVADITATWSGFKLLEYQLATPLLEHLLLRSDLRIIRLSRRNLLETVVSNLIARQTDLWKARDVDGPLEDRFRDLAPLDLAEVRDLLDGTKHLIDVADRILDRRSGPTLRVGYEELYLTDTAAQLARVWSFLGVDPPAAEPLAHHLDPAQVQIARPDTYGRVPNIAEIEATFGSDDVGHLTYL